MQLEYSTHQKGFLISINPTSKSNQHNVTLMVDNVARCIIPFYSQCLKNIL